MSQSGSLVKYKTPCLVSKGTKGKVGDPTTQTEDVLNSILPPREWTEDGQLWVQYVSSTPATRLDVVNLQDRLNHQLQARQARETGICPVREELYAQMMDELIRQVTISCAERGLLLLRVRDELRMTVSSYESLYESSIAYGIRKALMAAQQRRDLESRLGDLENNKKELRAQIDGLRKSIGESKTRLTEKKEADKKAHGEEVERIKKTNEQLRLSLESLLAAPPKK